MEFIANTNSKWGIREYNEWIEQERPINVTVTELNISQSNITTLDGIGNLTKLAILKCLNNQITSLNGLVNSTNLIKLDCSKNEITSFDGLENLTKLTELFCYNNQLTSLNGLRNLRHKTYILYYNNPIYNNSSYHVPPNIRRSLHRMCEAKNAYEDTENVLIEESIRTSIKNILAYKPVITDITNYILQDTILTDVTKETLLKYQSSSEVYLELNITFGELLMYIINRIEINEHRDEIKNILNVEMTDVKCDKINIDGSLCSIGRILRLVNSLSGLDSLVSIQKIDNEHIENITIESEQVTTLTTDLLDQSQSLTTDLSEVALSITDLLDQVASSTTDLPQSLTTDLLDQSQSLTTDLLDQSQSLTTDLPDQSQSLTTDLLDQSQSLTTDLLDQNFMRDLSDQSHDLTDQSQIFA